MDKLAINLKAAKLCGRSSSFVVNENRPFDIFTNPADREATVIALGEKHGINLSCQATGEGMCWEGYKQGEGCITYETNTGAGGYTEALAAAVAVI